LPEENQNIDEMLKIFSYDRPKMVEYPTVMEKGKQTHQSLMDEAEIHREQDDCGPPRQKVTKLRMQATENADRYLPQNVFPGYPN